MPPKKPHTVLTNVEIKAASLVDEGDNPTAHIVHLKSRQGAEGSMPESKWARFGAMVRKFMTTPIGEMGSSRTTDQVLAQRRFNDRFWELKSAYTTSMEEILEGEMDDDQRGLKLRESTEAFIRESMALTEAVASNDVSALKAMEATERLKAATAEDEITADFLEAIEGLEKLQPETEGDEANPEKEGHMPQEENKSAPALSPELVEGLKNVLPGIVQEVVQSEMEKAGMGKPGKDPKAGKAPADAEGNPKPAKKSADEAGDMDEATKAAFAAMEARVEAAEKRADDLAEKNALDAIKARVEKMGPTGMGTTDELASQIRDYEKSNPEMAAKFEQQLRALAAQKKQLNAISRSKGFAGDIDEDGEETLEAKVAKRAAEYREADKSLSEADARVKAWNDFSEERQERIAKARLQNAG